LNRGADWKYVMTYETYEAPSGLVQSFRGTDVR